MCDLLSDSEKIRTERKKAKSSKSKYTGVGNDEAGFGGSGKKYGGFGSEDLSYGSYSGQVYGTSLGDILIQGDGGGFTGPDFSGGSDFQDARPSRSATFEEYDEYDDGGARAPATVRSSVPRKSTPKKENDVPPPKKEKDLLGWDDDEGIPPVPASNGKGKAAKDLVEDDDFDDFQSASGPTTTSTRMDLPSLFSAPQPTAARGTMPTSSTSTFPNFGTTPSLQQPIHSPLAQPLATTITSPPSTTANYQPNYFSPPPTTTTVPSHLPKN